MWEQAAFRDSAQNTWAGILQLLGGDLMHNRITALKCDWGQESVQAGTNIRRAVSLALMTKKFSAPHQARPAAVPLTLHRQAVAALQVYMHGWEV